MNSEEYVRSSEDSSWSLTIVAVGALFAVWGWALVNLPELHNIAITYGLMTLGAMTLGGLAYVSDNKFPFSVLGFPKLKDIALPVAAGATYGATFILLGGGIVSITKLFNVESPFTNLPPLQLYLLYGVFSPGAEDILFQSTVLPLLTRVTKHPATGILLTMMAVGSVHWYTFGGSLPFILVAIIFTAGTSFLTLHFRTAAAAMSAHSVYNLILIYFFLHP